MFDTPSLEHLFRCKQSEKDLQKPLCFTLKVKAKGRLLSSCKILEKFSLFTPLSEFDTSETQELPTMLNFTRWHAPGICTQAPRLFSPI